MPAPTPIPQGFSDRPFHRREFTAAGLSPKLLLGRRFHRVFPGVWARTGHLLTDDDLRLAAGLCLPDAAALSHHSRIQALGLDLGPASPVHFTIDRDLHLAIDGIVLHRTAVLPPRDAVGVTAAGAFIQSCSRGRLIDLIAVGDWLLHHGHADVLEIGELSLSHPWRPGARQAQRVLPWLDRRSASLKESEQRALVLACGLPEPEVNADVYHRGQRIAITDLLFSEWGVAVEYEGRQHAESAVQFHRDISRYAAFRDIGLDYLQVTQSMLAQPRALMLRIDDLLRRRGYAGPPPTFDHRWKALFRAP